jgi:hypothetical protein
MVTVTPQFLTGIEVASVVCAVVTTAFALVVRLFWRREKSLREP